MNEARFRTLSHQEIDALLRELGAELERDGIRGDLFVVGGAAMALAYNLRRITADVDAIFEPKEAVYRAARRVAEVHPELPDDWLNAPGIRVSIASPGYLLALKVLAARQDRDSDDGHRRVSISPRQEALDRIVVPGGSV